MNRNSNDQIPIEGRIDPKAREWRCQNCSRLLGKHRDGHVHIEYGERYRNAVDGQVIAICPKCSAINTTRSDSDRREKCAGCPRLGA